MICNVWCISVGGGGTVQTSNTVEALTLRAPFCMSLSYVLAKCELVLMILLGIFYWDYKPIIKLNWWHCQVWCNVQIYWNTQICIMLCLYELKAYVFLKLVPRSMFFIGCPSQGQESENLTDHPLPTCMGSAPPPPPIALTLSAKRVHIGRF